MLVIALIAALSGQAAADDASLVDPLTIRPAVKEQPYTLPDGEIVAQLNALRKAEPDRVICLTKRDLGSLIPRNVCASLSQWYAIETARDTQYVVSRIKGEPAGDTSPALGPPHELIEFVKERLKNPEARAQAARRGAQRAALSQETPIQPK
jgi:hypothetical protein